MTGIFSDPDQALYEILSRYRSSMIGGVVGGPLLTTDFLPVGDERSQLAQELESTGLDRVIVDTSSGDSIVVGSIGADEAKSLTFRAMRNSPHKPRSWPTMPGGTFPLVGSWAYPYSNGDATGRDLFTSGQGSRPMRVFLAPDVLRDPTDRDLNALLGLLQETSVETLVLEAEREGVSHALSVRFVPDAESPLEGSAEWGSTSHFVHATDAARLWGAHAYRYFRDLPDDAAKDCVEREVLLSHVAAAAGADIVVTRSRFLLAFPDGVSNHTPHLAPADAHSVVGLYLRQRDTYVVRPSPVDALAVITDRSHFLRAAARGVLPNLYLWRAVVDAQPSTSKGSPSHLGESFERRISRMLGNRDEMLAALLVRQDANTAFRAMEHLDAFLTNLQAAFDVLANVVELLVPRPKPAKGMSISWTRGKWRSTVAADHPELDSTITAEVLHLLKLMGILRNTIHSEMLVPRQSDAQPRTGVTLAEFRPRDPVAFEADIRALGEADEWGYAVDGSTVTLDVRRFIELALEPLLHAMDAILRWSATLAGDADHARPDEEFGAWFPDAVREQMAVRPPRANVPARPWNEPAGQPFLGRPQSELSFTGVLGAPTLSDQTLARDTRLILRGQFPAGSQPYKDFNNGDRLTAHDPLLDDGRLMRVVSLGYSEDHAAQVWTVMLRSWPNGTT